MSIFFVNPFPSGASGINEATIEPPLGLAYLSAVLEERGFECTILDANVLRIKNEKVLKEIGNRNPELVGISMNIVTASAGVELTRMLKEEYPNIPVIFGGPYPTALPTELLRKTPAEAVVVGEGEATVLEVAEKLKRGDNPFAGVNGLFYKETEEKIVSNPPRPLIEDLNTLPFPAYHLLPDLNVYKSRARATPVASILTSRGCPYGCVYCNKNIFGRKFRARSPENVLKEIDLLVKNYGVKQIDILDDNFTLDRERTDRILDLILERGYDLKINCQNGVRADRMDLALIKKMKKAGVFKIGIGVESGDERVSKIIKKHLDLDKAIEATRWAKEEGIIVYGNFMLGLPGDDRESMVKTIEFSKRMDPHIANYTVTVPLPGTEFFEMVEREGRFLEDTTSGISSGFYGSKVYYEMGSVKAVDVKEMFERAYREFYFRPRKLLEILLSIKSLSELQWTLEAAAPLLARLLKRRDRGEVEKKRSA